jgi:hypothetical protein
VQDEADEFSSATRLDKTSIVLYVMFLGIGGLDPAMRRRGYITVLGVGILSAGCLSERDGAGPSTNTPNDADLEMCTTGENALEGFSVGESTTDINPHELTIQNDGDSSRTISLRITNADLDEALLDRSCLLGAGKDISGELREPAEYRVAVTMSDSEREHVTSVDYFDTCNDYVTTVTLSPEGTITSETVTTEVACDSTSFRS